jgi:hypothetical protein
MVTSARSKPQGLVKATSSSSHPSTHSRRPSWNEAARSSPNSPVSTTRSTSGRSVSGNNLFVKDGVYLLGKCDPTVISSSETS